MRYRGCGVGHIDTASRVPVPNLDAGPIDDDDVIDSDEDEQVVEIQDGNMGLDGEGTVGTAHQSTEDDEASASGSASDDRSSVSDSDSDSESESESSSNRSRSDDGSDCGSADIAYDQ